MSNGSGLVGYRNTSVLLSDNGSGVLLCRPSAGARLPKRNILFKYFPKPPQLIYQLIYFFHQGVRT